MHSTVSLVIISVGLLALAAFSPRSHKERPKKSAKLSQFEYRWSCHQFIIRWPILNNHEWDGYASQTSIIVTVLLIGSEA